MGEVFFCVFFHSLTILRHEINSMCDRMLMISLLPAKLAHTPILPHSIQPAANIAQTLSVS